ncbi:hypothetical protein FO519_005199 [Halicephalobus sp. NKZ332]|nr:hypothetical protein FO519_005199 [Halicephalobus sp. NKZ332]
MPTALDVGALFEAFVQATNLRQIQLLFHQICLTTDINPTDHVNLYQKIRRVDDGKVNSKAQKLWSLLDKRRNHGEYLKQSPCSKMNVLVIGAGPCGLRAAIEAALLGAKVVVVEQRDKFSRNNVLHLWEFVIQDLKSLGAKIFYPKFCTGSIEHISIRQLQCILTKVALVLGVQIIDGISFCDILEPTGSQGWRATFEPHSHLLSEFEFDVLIGADGKRNTLSGFPRQVVRGKLAIGITANFVNNKSAAEEKVQEISGVAYIFNQAFFKDMLAETGVDLENIVYYKDETHYFVMCAKKQSLISKGVIKRDFDDVGLLLARENVDQEMLCKYAMQAADFATEGKLPQLEYSTNHRGQCDVAMFDFTALYSAVYSTRFIERKNKGLIISIVGDSLHEPFWPTGSGCARGFLGVLDTAWMLRSFGLNKKCPAEVIAERESILKHLAQTTKEKMCKGYHKYTINPRTRYQTIARCVEIPQIMEAQIDSDVHSHQIEDFYLPPWGQGRSTTEFDRKCRLMKFCHQALLAFRLKMVNFKASCWGDGKALCALVSKFRSDLIDYISICSTSDPDYMLDQVFSCLEDKYGIQRPCCSHIGWVNISDERRIDFIEELVNSLKQDQKGFIQILSPSVKLNMSGNSRKRVKNYVFDFSKTKRSEQIKRRAGDLLNAMAGTSVVDDVDLNQISSKKETRENYQEMRSDYGESKNDDYPEPRNNVYQEPKNTQETSIDFHQELERPNKYSSCYQQPQKKYTPRPNVDKLNPEVVYRVNQIVTGDWEKSKWKRIYDEKQKTQLTKKMERETLEQVEQKLENVGNEFSKSRNSSMSSQEEKLMKINAASARDVVKSDFEIDEKISKAENVLKFNQLSGVNTVTKFKEQVSSRPKVIKVPPPTPPKPMITSSSSSFDDERENREISFRPIHQNAGYNKKPLVNQDLYASVLPRRKNLCALCGVEVYLAEQMHIDKLMIHKKCFKCSYCAQPLRLGNCGLDRTLMDEHGPRWFCQLHINVQLGEKIARIQKSERMKMSVAIVPPTQTPILKPMVAGEKISYSDENSKNKNNVTIKYANIDTPAMLAKKTMDRMNLRKEKLETLKLTPTTERVEFECYRNRMNNNEKVKEMERKSLESSSSNELESSLDDEEIEFGDGSSGTGANSENSENERILNTKESYTSTEDEAEDDEDLWTEFTEVLENTLTKSENCSNQEISEKQAVKWIETFNKRASLLMMSPKTPESLYFTPKTEIDATPKFFTPSTTVLKRHDLSETRMKSFDGDDTLTNITSIPCNSSPTKSFVSGASMEEKNAMNSLLDNMPSLQRTNLSNNGLIKAKMFNPLTNSPIVVSKPIFGASESQKEANMLDRIRRLKMRTERRATVAIDPMMMGFKKDENDFGSEFSDERLFEQEKQQKSIQSGNTTMIEIKDNDAISKFDGFKISNMDEKKSKMTELERKKRLRSKTLTNGVQKEHLKEAMAYISPVITASPKNIKRVQKQAEKILKRREHERQRTAQDVQRGLDETENRINEVNSVGVELEGALRKDPMNAWLLENWLLYVQELRQLKLREEDLNRRVREISISDEYHKLKAQLAELQADIIPGEFNSNIELEGQIMSKVVKVLGEHQKIRKEMDENIRQSRKTVFDVKKLLEDRSHSFNNFEPVFTNQFPPNFDLFC